MKGKQIYRKKISFLYNNQIYYFDTDILENILAVFFF